MERKPLVGICICAVLLLILCSLSNVVGYQSVKSTAVNESPLFQTRTQRATNQQQNVLTSRYLGMGKRNLLQFPIKNNNITLLKRAVELISKMDEKKFERFTELYIQKAKQDSTLQDATSNDIKRAIYLLKTKPETILKSIIDNDNYNLTSSRIITLCDWVPFCITKWIMFSIIVIIAIVGGTILVILSVGGGPHDC